jgi:NADH:ubiquinone oxidoreductase subunit 3 (subunit A)
MNEIGIVMDANSWSEILLSPPVAFLAYLLLVAALSGLGRMLAGPARATPLKMSTYSSGEAPPRRAAAPGYRPFFVAALFFAILHLGVLVVATGGFTPAAAIFLVGLSLSLLALILG